MKTVRLSITVLDTIEFEDKDLDLTDDELQSYIDCYANALQEAMDNISLGGAVNDVEYDIEEEEEI